MIFINAALAQTGHFLVAMYGFFYFQEFHNSLMKNYLDENDIELRIPRLSGHCGMAERYFFHF